MSESMRMQSQLTADLEVYRAKGELIALRAENARLREALEEMAGNLMGSPKRKLMLSDDDFWQTPGEHTLRQWLARVALQSEREQP